MIRSLIWKALPMIGLYLWRSRSKSKALSNNRVI